MVLLKIVQGKLNQAGKHFLRPSKSTTVNAQALANMAFEKYRLAKLGRTNSEARFGGNLSLAD